MPTSTEKEKTFFLDSKDIQEVTGKDISIMISKTDLELIIKKGKEELAKADKENNNPYRVYKNDTDTKLQTAIEACEPLLTTSGTTKAEFETHVGLVETAINNLEYDLGFSPDENDGHVPDLDV